MYIFEDSDSIYFRQTREYFQEVMSSYSIGNYRSANVMLYSVVICDLLYKLQELKDMYNDSQAINILVEVDKERKNNTGSKSSWEHALVERLYRETELLSDEDYMNVDYLYNNRNFSAHPALNDNYELIAPSKETTAANIKNALKILVKPPVFIKKIVGFLVDDLRDNKEIYENAHDVLKSYLNNKYYSKMSITMKINTLKALWKFCFQSPDNPDCMDNNVINRRALEYLIETIPRETEDFIKENSMYFSVSSDDACSVAAVVLLAKFPSLYEKLSSEAKLVIDRCIEKNDGAKYVAWFKYPSFIQHITYLKSCRNLKSNKQCTDFMLDHYTAIGKQSELLDFFIELYGESELFDVANYRFADLIKPNLFLLNKDQFIKILEYTNSNFQLYARREALISNDSILKVAKNCLPPEFDYSSYENLKYSSHILESHEQENEEVEIDFS